MQPPLSEKMRLPTDIDTTMRLLLMPAQNLHIGKRMCLALLLFLLTGISVRAQKITAADYKQFFPGHQCSRTAFHLAIRGYYILRREGLLTNPHFLTIIDYSKPGNRKRLFVLDVEHHRVAVSSIAAHGIGSDPDSTGIPYRFSNRNNSKTSSIGFYITGDTYTNFRPRDSTGLCLFGLDKGYNDSAAVREIVIHYGAKEHTGEVYVTDSGAARSYGCPALPLSTNGKVIGLIKGGSCLFIYSSRERGFARHSTVLNKALPERIIQKGPPPNNCSCNLQPASGK
jgi:hypothetical protein